MNDPASVLALTLIPGLGPVLISRALGALGGAEAVLAATPERLRTVPGIGPERAKLFREHRAASVQKAAVELARARDLGATVIALGTPDYPPLLAEAPDPPPIVYVRGRLEPASRDRYGVALVGSRDCTHYGLEQAARFAGGLAQAGLTIVSGGARGVDSSAHRAALNAGGRTIVVLGSGVNVPYPPENADLLAQVERQDAGAIVSELPLDTPPAPENFPARNRIIAGLSLGVVVVEAGKRSGALITARLATEDLGREVFGVPGRVDSRASEGVLELLKGGGAHLVTDPADILAILREPARHHHQGTHAARFVPAHRQDEAGLFADAGGSGGEKGPGGEAGSVGGAGGARSSPIPSAPGGASRKPPERTLKEVALSPGQRAVLEALDEPRTLDDLCARLAIDPSALRADVTILELRRCIVRQGSRLARAPA